MKISIASDHGGFRLKEELKCHLEKKGIEFIDCGTDTEESCDYPDFAVKACKLVQNKVVEFAILICGTGIGMSITANKMKGIRAALCGDEFSAFYTRAHNDANVLVLPGRFVDNKTAETILDEFFSTTFEGGRHERRVKKIPVQH